MNKQRLLKTFIFFVISFSGTNCHLIENEQNDQELLYLLILANQSTSCKGEANYEVSFRATWSAATHSGGTLGFPANAHFSAVVGTTHNTDAIYWNPGSLASAGMESMAETGKTAILKQEFISSDAADCPITFTDSVSSSPATITSSFALSRSHPRVTMVTMLAPSPDWFIGINSLNLMENDQFLSTKTTTLYAYDSGTDDGTTFTAADSDTNPKSTISLVNDSPLSGNAVGDFHFIKK